MNWEEQYDRIPLVGDLSDVKRPISFKRVDDTSMEGLWDHVMREHHHLGYEDKAGRRVKYLVSLGNKLLGAVGFCSAANKLAPRDVYVGWDDQTRLQYLPHLLNNNRFLIFPWINVKNLASYFLFGCVKRVKEDWKKKYEAEPYMIETFVDHESRLGSAYAAANWIHLGVSKVLGKAENSYLFKGRERDVYVTVTNRRFATMFKPDLSRVLGVKDEIVRLLNKVPVECPSVLKAVGAEGAPSQTILAPLADHIERYTPYLGRKEHLAHMIAMFKGRLSELKRKTPEPIASAFEGKDEVRNFLNFMSKSLFDESGMLGELHKDIASLFTHPEGMITADEVDFHKKGKHSVGVARQESKFLKKRDNCQASVMTGYSSPLGRGLTDFALYMPSLWFEQSYAKLRKKCHLPSDIEYKKKEELLSQMLERTLDSEVFMVKYIGLDASFGENDALWDSLPAGLVKFAEVPLTHKVFIRESKDSEYSRLVMMKDLAEDPTLPWESLPPARNDLKNLGLHYRDRCLKVRKSREGEMAEELWLYIRTYDNGSEKYALSDESLDAPPSALTLPANLRWSMEDCIKECSELLGMSHYEVRTFKAWRRQMLFTFISHLFVNKLRQNFPATNIKPEKKLIAL
jgi:SRSO17 transposase